MKNIIRKSVIAASFVLAVAASSFKANAQDTKLVYDKSVNPSIGITIENAAGRTYEIKDKKGNIVYKGVVKGNKTIFISTLKLKGAYQFQLGNQVVQEFIIK